jgi:conflict system STAND superfamily ATPase
MANQLTANPYRPLPDDDPTSAPFAGRQKAFEFLYQQLTNPAGTETSLIIGRRDSGKTALLNHFSRFFDESFLGVMIPLKGNEFTSEADWLNLFVDGAARELAERNYTLSRLPEFEGAASAMRAWFTETYLPEILNVIRRHRRLVFLLDDADVLLKVIQDGKLPDDTIAFLHGLVQSNPQFGLVLTLDVQYESDIAQLSPLATLEDIFRLTNLSGDEASWLLTEPAAEQYKLSPETATAVYKATGGQPRLLQCFGFELFRLWEGRPNRPPFTLDDIKQVTAAVYAQSEADLRGAWSAATRNERLVLTAISSLIYADPLGKITPTGIESWLVETDYPMDGTGINAAIRGLEYREMVEHTPDGIRLNAGMMQTWLLENGRLNERTGRPDIHRPALRWLALAGIAILVLALVLIASQGGTTPASGNAIVEPTVTLMTNP